MEGVPIFYECCFAADFFILKRLERWSVVTDYLGWEAVSCKETVQSIAVCFCSCYLDLHWTNEFWPLGVDVDYEKVVVGLSSVGL